MITSSVKTLDDMRQKVNILVSEEKISSLFEKNYKDIQKKAKMPGFREGKVPLHLIRKNYRDYAYKNVLSDVLKDSFYEALKKHSLIPVSKPELKFKEKELKEGKGFEFEAEFEVWPEIPVHYKPLDIKMKKPQITDKDCDNFIESLRSQFSTLSPVLEDRPSKEGDVLMVDFLGKIDGVLFEGGKGENVQMELGSKRWLPDFEQGLRGMKKGEKKTFPVKFPSDYHEKSLIGKTASFEAEVKDIQKKVLPELNDDFAKKLNPEVTNLDDLKKDIKKSLFNQEAQKLKSELIEEILKLLREKNKVENFPPTLLKNQIEFFTQRTLHELKEKGMKESDLGAYKEKHKSDFEKQSKDIIHSQKLIHDLARQKNITVNPQKIEERFFSVKPYLSQDLTEEQERNMKDKIETELLQTAVIEMILKEHSIDSF